MDQHFGELNYSSDFMREPSAQGAIGAPVPRRENRESISQLLHIESLLDRLSESRPASSSAPPAREELIPLDIKELQWPGGLLSSTLKQRLPSSPSRPFHHVVSASEALAKLGMPAEFSNAPSPLTAPIVSRDTHQLKLQKVLEILVKDVLAARDRLLALNPGRRRMIEHRLEFIARRVARMRGERYNRNLSLPEVLKESFRDAGQAPTKLTGLAWRAFVSEVALYQVLELFFLKSLDVHGWRRFEPSDLGRLNFAANSFLGSRAAGFAHDKHCWNFVRTNLYSWYVPSMRALGEIAEELSSAGLEGFDWSDLALERFIGSLPADLRPMHVDLESEKKAAALMIELLETQLGSTLVSRFQGRPICKKFFVPALESGGVALSILDRMLGQVRSTDEGSQIQRAIWACESESFEIFWSEVMAVLKILRSAPSRGDWAVTDCQQNPLSLYRLPHALHAVQGLGLELHNLEQLHLGGAEVSKMQQGSAAQIQQLETFDGAFVTDHPDRTKSAKWMKAISEQLPYWRSLVGSSTNLNWGELHLQLAVSKLKEEGYCLYLSHRVLPEGGDGERLRKSLLNVAILECFIELPEEMCVPYRYLYVFRRSSSKNVRDSHRPRYGHFKSLQGNAAAAISSLIDLSQLEEANCSQAEISERGWDHLFVRGSAPLVRHLNHKFPKLGHFASVQSLAALAANHPHERGSFANERSETLFQGMDTKALVGAVDKSGGLKFMLFQAGNPSHASHGAGEKLVVFPHNPADLSWIQYLLNSGPAQFWIRHQVLAGAPSSSPANAAALPTRSLRLADVRSCPILDLSHASTEAVHEYLAWLGETKPNAETLRLWGTIKESPVTERFSKYVAAARRCASLDRVVGRYRSLFTSNTFEELKPEAVTQFYPATLLCHISQSPDLRVQYVDRAKSNYSPESWVIADLYSVVQNSGGRPLAYTVVHTRQGPTIQIVMPLAIRDYLNSQLRMLRDHTWSEAISLLRVPRDIPLFAAQTTEITRVVVDTAREISLYESVLEEMALDLFEVSPDLRQYLPHL